MARWIDATPSQRWHQYQKPADQKMITEAGEVCSKWIFTIKKLFAQRHTITPRRGRRRVRTEIMHLRNYMRSVDDARARLARFG